MKKPKLRPTLFLYIFTFLAFHFTQAQEVAIPHLKISASVSPISSRNVGAFENLMGAGSKESSRYFAADILLTKTINQHFSWTTGLGYSTQNIEIFGSYPGPNDAPYYDKTRLDILEAPILARADFFKYLYANIGPIVHLQVTKKHPVLDPQNGIGAQIAVGGNINLGSCLGIFAEPVFKYYSLIPFHTAKNPDRIGFIGAKVGLTYAIQ